MESAAFIQGRSTQRTSVGSTTLTKGREINNLSAYAVELLFEGMEAFVRHVIQAPFCELHSASQGRDSLWNVGALHSTPCCVSHQS